MHPDDHPEILDLAHEDLKRLSAGGGKGSGGRRVG